MIFKTKKRMLGDIMATIMLDDKIEVCMTKEMKKQVLEKAKKASLKTSAFIRIILSQHLDEY